MLELLSKIKLSISQVLMLLVAGIIGYLTLMLKLKGSQLHKAQVDLLKQRVDILIEKDDAKVSKAKADYKQALKVFRDNQ